MPFAHENLDVYRLALDSLVLADDIVENLPRGRGHLADQLSRASTSIVLNIAQGASEVLETRQAPPLLDGCGLYDRVRGDPRRVPSAEARCR